ncbi:hypothetical protein FH972_019104 [Carpinus fangiana]|uniref:Endonuclease/exonuclease/phosphatase domain-containing protein n=1 Tax=Carpinus fangiana TaxID=176857 RepID=A0A5N6RP92_9ROSI|nr:hypothetical protein FH972_019104 [Carpinus fangiana]
MPYSLDRKSYTAPPPKVQPTSPALAHSQLTPTNTATSYYPASISASLGTSLESPHPIPSPPEKPPFIYPTNVSMVTTPSLVSHSRGKGNMKWIEDEDDIPLAKLKKSRHEDSAFIESLSPLEIAAYSFTQLQHATTSTGPVQDFMVQPLQRFQGRLLGFLPQPVVFAPEVATILDQVEPPSTVSTGISSPSADSVAVYYGTPRRFFRSIRGHRRASSAVVVSQSTSSVASLSQVNPENQEECLERPPPSPCMKFLAWNCRGLSSASAIRSLRDKIRNHSPDVIFCLKLKCILHWLL